LPAVTDNSHDNLDKSTSDERLLKNCKVKMLSENVFTN